MLQDLVFIDDNHRVRVECGRCLGAMGLDVVGDLNLCEAIQSKVQELGKRENIIEFIMKEDEGKSEENDAENADADDSTATKEPGDFPAIIPDNASSSEAFEHYFAYESDFEDV